MKKVILLIFPLLILLLNVDAMVYPDSIFEFNINGGDSCANATTSGANAFCDAGGLDIDETAAAANCAFLRKGTESYMWNLTGDSNISLQFQMRVNSSGNGAYGFWANHDSNRTSTNSQFSFSYRSGGSNLYLGKTSDNSNLCDLNMPVDNTLQNISFRFYFNDSDGHLEGLRSISGNMTQVCVNQAFFATASYRNATVLTVGDGDNGAGVCTNFGTQQIKIKELRIINLSYTPLGLPEITFYNMTSEGGNGCTNWNTDKNNPCQTSDVTPTVFFRTNINANCAIGVSDLNYAGMGSIRQCSGGQGTTQHTCDLNVIDELVYEVSFIYIGCADTSGNQNPASTSGALSMNITNLDITAGNSVELGATNSLARGFTTYTNQKIYARNSANSQTIGTFDRVVKRLSKIWAFNRIGISDSHVNMFNITPVLYTLEFANKTSSNITLEVEKLLNATK